MYACCQIVRVLSKHQAMGFRKFRPVVAFGMVIQLEVFFTFSYLQRHKWVESIRLLKN